MLAATRFFACAAFAALVLVPNPIGAAVLTPAAAAGWQNDLDYLVRCIENYHVNAFHDTSRHVFEQRASELRARIPHLTRSEAILGLAALTALVGDAHTGFSLGTAPPVSFHTFPIKVYQYSDGVFVQAAAPEYARLVGSRIVAVGGVPISEALRRLRTVVMATNEWSFRSQLQFAFKGEIFHALGLSSNDETASLALATASGSETVEVRVLPELFSIGYKPGVPAGSDWVGSAPATPALFLRHLDKNYWYEWIARTHTLYVQCNFILNDEKQSFADFFNEVFATADARPVSKFVLDLRFNGGGDNSLLPIVIRNIVRRENLDARGKLFVIVGRLTQSAAENLVNRLQRDTHATFVGEPTGERPNVYGDPWPFVLPDSGITVNVASLQWEDIDPRDDRNWTGPDVAAELTSSDYAAGTDPAMEAIDGPPFVPIESVLRPLVTSDPSAVPSAFARYLDNPAHRFVQAQLEVENIASELSSAGKFAAAQGLLQTSAERSPNSAAALDAFCDSYLPSRELAKAGACFKSVLEKFPRDAIAASRLSLLGAGVIPNT